MDRILDKARGSQNFLEHIANVIPGFSGYRERDLRRTADALQREHLATRLEQTKKALNDLSAQSSRAGAWDALNDIETARKRLDKVIARVRYADRGYSGFFDAVKVDEAALNRVYEFDLGILDQIDVIGGAAAEAAKVPKDPGAALKNLIGAIDAIDNSLEQRETLLRGIQ
jgi:hypothetical protein